jgi:sugar phosphate isomerase/epimerase
MTRREALAAGAALAGALPLRARSGWDKTRISAITDEVGTTIEESIAFAHQYGLSFVELRDKVLPRNRREYFTVPEAEIQADALLFKREGLKVSFVNTSLLKFTLPGMEPPPRRRPEDPAAKEKRLAAAQARFDRRMEDLNKAIRCAQLMNCDKVRVFTGDRVQDPPSVYPKIAGYINEMAEVAAKAKVYLVVENEGSQNVSTAAEIAEFMNLVPSKWIGFMWDPHNAYGREKTFPDAYKLLPLKRLMNVQVKAMGILPTSPEKEDWKAIMQALDRDGYKGKLGLETHIYDGTLIEKAHICMEEMLRIVRELG